MKLLFAILVIVLALLMWKPSRMFFTNSLGALLYHFYRELVYLFRPCYNGKLPDWVLKEDYGEYLMWRERQQQKSTLSNIAVVSPNRSKFSETFIRQHVKQLKDAGYYVHELYGGYLPTAEATEGLLYKNSNTLRAFYKWIELLLGLPEGHYDKLFFKKYLRRNNVKLVFAEYGTTAAAIVDSVREIDIPLLVMFHGYDAWNMDVLDANRKKYADVFAYAGVVFGVSKSICKQLAKLGCSAQKVVHLPAPVNTNLFTYSDHSTNPVVFLSVGRFANQKSPHLLLLSINEVLKKLPQAKLVMVGADDGTSLHEACISLATALNILHAVDFKGALPPEEVFAEMKTARVLVQHSIVTPMHGDREGTPVSVMEAMASGLPVIATRHEGIEDLIENRETGLLVEEYDYLAMAEAMIELAHNNDIVKKLGLAASDFILLNNSVETNSNLLKQHVAENLKRR